MKFLSLFLLTSSLASYGLEQSSSSNSSSTSPRFKESPRKELQIDGEIKRIREFSKHNTRLKRITYLATFKSGNSLEITCTFKKNKPSKYSGKVIKNGEENQLNVISAEQDYNKLNVLYLEKNSDRF